MNLYNLKLEKLSVLSTLEKSPIHSPELTLCRNQQPVPLYKVIRRVKYVAPYLLGLIIETNKVLSKS